VQQLVGVVEELLVERLVQAIGGVEGGDPLRSRPQSHGRPGGAARDQVDQDERQDRDANHDHDGLGNAPCEVSGHFGL
jgi:hypothetical protein